ncbi:MAG: TIGR04076 family protein [Acutalibacteraceae bacterium]
MKKVRLTITESNCRNGYFEKGEEYIVEDLCPPLCHELWNTIYPMVYSLQNGAVLDYGDCKAKMFDAKCPDMGRVSIHGEVIEE